MNLTGVDVRVLSHELNQSIVGSWIVNIYHLPSGIFIFKLRRAQEGLQFLIVEPGKRLHLSQFNRVMPKEPTNFCMSLRKHLRDRRINSVIQRDLDRIVTINIGPDEGFNLVVELFGRGNMIVVRPDNKILSASSYRKMRDRDIHPGKEYMHMPAVDKDILRTGTEGLREVLSQTDKLVPALSSWMGLGPYYSRYILKLASIDKKKSKELEDDEIELLTSKAEEIKTRLEKNDYSPVVVLDSNQNIVKDDVEDDLEDEDHLDVSYDEQWDNLDFNPEQVVKILPWEQDIEGELFHPASLGAALDIYFSSQEEEEDISGETEELTTEADRLNNQMTLQKAHQVSFLEEAAEFRRDADALYESFQPASELISTVYDARRNKMNWEDIEERLRIGKTKGIKSAILFNSLEISKGLMKLDLPTNGSQRTVIIDFRKSFNEIANDFYTKAKKSEKKAKGADIAIERTRVKIEEAESSKSILTKIVTDQTVILKRRKVWYEKWHWTRAVTGQLIIAGVDAVTNERIVKTYLDEDDMFLHADIHGAAATVVKADGQKINDKTLQTAGIISVAYSSAWKLQRPTASAYAVTKEQVSLSAPSGQFLPQGGFMIYGTKKFIHDIPLRLFIGLILEKHWARLVLGTDKDAEILQPCAIVVEIVPGDDQRGSIAKAIKKGFIRKMEDNELNKIKAIDIGDFAQLIPGSSKISAWITKK